MKLAQFFVFVAFLSTSCNPTGGLDSGSTDSGTCTMDASFVNCNELENAFIRDISSTASSHGQCASDTDCVDRHISLVCPNGTNIGLCYVSVGSSQSAQFDDEAEALAAKYCACLKISCMWSDSCVDAGHGCHDGSCN